MDEKKPYNLSEIAIIVVFLALIAFFFLSVLLSLSLAGERERAYSLGKNFIGVDAEIEKKFFWKDFNFFTDSEIDIKSNINVIDIYGVAVEIELAEGKKLESFKQLSKIENTDFYMAEGALAKQVVRLDSPFHKNFLFFRFRSDTDEETKLKIIRRIVEPFSQ